MVAAQADIPAAGFVVAEPYTGVGEVVVVVEEVVREDNVDLGYLASTLGFAS